MNAIPHPAPLREAFLLALSLTCVAGCAGKETGDEGHETNLPSSEVAENGTDEPEPSEPEEAPSGEVPAPYCEFYDYLEPGSPRYSCNYGEASLDFINWRPGDATPAGPYRCQCAGEPYQEVTDAEDCVDAMATACGVDPTVEQCFERSSGKGLCEADTTDEENWRCRCDSDGSVEDIDAASCDLAVFSTCGPPSCTDATGACEKLDDQVGYACQCADGTTATWPGAFDCAAALSHCSPACESTRGACSRRYEGFDCSCTEANESQPIFVGNDAAYGVCLFAVEIACGAPPLGEQCEEQDEHATVICTADGDGGWDCTCDRVESEPAPSPAPTSDSDFLPSVPATGITYGNLGGATVAPHAAPPDDVQARQFACRDAIWTACE